jgi:hypothetical protein
MTLFPAVDTAHEPDRCFQELVSVERLGQQIDYASMRRRMPCFRGGYTPKIISYE